MSFGGRIQPLAASVALCHGSRSKRVQRPNRHLSLTRTPATVQPGHVSRSPGFSQPPSHSVVSALENQTQTAPAGHPVPPAEAESEAPRGEWPCLGSPSSGLLAPGWPSSDLFSSEMPHSFASCHHWQVSGSHPAATPHTSGLPGHPFPFTLAPKWMGTVDCDCPCAWPTFRPVCYLDAPPRGAPRAPPAPTMISLVRLMDETVSNRPVEGSDHAIHIGGYKLMRGRASHLHSIKLIELQAGRMGRPRRDSVSERILMTREDDSPDSFIN